MNDVFERYLICEFTTVSQDKPVTFPMLYFYDASSGKFTVTSSVLFSKKVEHIKRNPKVSLLFSNPEGSNIGKQAVLVQGTAVWEDLDLDHAWERFLPYWRKKEPYIDAFLADREKFGWFWKRIVVQVQPERVVAWKSGDTSIRPEIFR